VKAGVSAPCIGSLDWSDFVATKGNVLLWEAFVSDKSKGEDHIADAVLAVDELLRRTETGQLNTDVTAENPFSLIGAAMIRAGWTANTNLLHKMCVVIKVSKSSRSESAKLL
jgi:hypothetical protein